MYLDGLEVEASRIANTPLEYQPLVDQVRSKLTPDLLKPEYAGGEFPSGHCYVATEAIYHLLGGAASGLKPVRLRMPDGVVHWWLETPEGAVIDATHDQYEHIPYAEGRGGGFYTKQPSKRAQTLMSRISRVKTNKIITLPNEFKPHNDYNDGRQTWIYFEPSDTLFIAPNNALHTDIWYYLSKHYPEQYKQLSDEYGVDKSLIALGLMERNYEDQALEARSYWAEGEPLPSHILDEMSNYFGERVYQRDWEYPVDWTQVHDMPDDHDGEWEETQQWPTDALQPFESKIAATINSTFTFIPAGRILVDQPAGTHPDQLYTLMEEFMIDPNEYSTRQFINEYHPVLGWTFTDDEGVVHPVFHSVAFTEDAVGAPDKDQAMAMDALRKKYPNLDDPLPYEYGMSDQQIDKYVREGKTAEYQEFKVVEVPCPNDWESGTPFYIIDDIIYIGKENAPHGDVYMWLKQNGLWDDDAIGGWIDPYSGIYIEPNAIPSFAERQELKETITPYLEPYERVYHEARIASIVLEPQQRQQLTVQCESLAAATGSEINWMSMPQWAAKNLRRIKGEDIVFGVVYCPRIQTDADYYVALHEIGHNYFFTEFGRREPMSSPVSYEEELWVDHWVLENSQIPFAYDTLEQMRLYLNAYQHPSNPFTSPNKRAPNWLKEDQTPDYGSERFELTPSIGEQANQIDEYTRRDYERRIRERGLAHIAALDYETIDKLYENLQFLAYKLDVEIRFVRDIPASWSSIWHIETGMHGLVKFIQVPELRNLVDYAVALHELGHAAFFIQHPNIKPNQNNAVNYEGELWAHHWALENSIVPLDQQTLEEVYHSLKSYDQHWIPKDMGVGWITNEKDDDLRLFDADYWGDKPEQDQATKHMRDHTSWDTIDYGLRHTPLKVTRPTVRPDDQLPPYPAYGMPDYTNEAYQQKQQEFWKNRTSGTIKTIPADEGGHRFGDIPFVYVIEDQTLWTLDGPGYHPNVLAGIGREDVARYRNLRTLETGDQLVFGEFWPSWYDDMTYERHADTVSVEAYNPATIPQDLLNTLMQMYPGVQIVATDPDGRKEDQVIVPANEQHQLLSAVIEVPDFSFGLRGSASVCYYNGDLYIGKGHHPDLMYRIKQQPGFDYKDFKANARFGWVNKIRPGALSDIYDSIPLGSNYVLLWSSGNFRDLEGNDQYEEEAIQAVREALPQLAAIIEQDYPSVNYDSINNAMDMKRLRESMFDEVRFLDDIIPSHEHLEMFGNEKPWVFAHDTYYVGPFGGSHGDVLSYIRVSPRTYPPSGVIRNGQVQMVQGPEYHAQRLQEVLEADYPDELLPTKSPIGWTRDANVARAAAPIDWKQIRMQLYDLAAQYGINLVFSMIMHWSDAAGYYADADGAINEIYTPVVLDDLTYAVALHEIGHFAFVKEYERLPHTNPNTLGTYEEELWVDHWMLEHAQIPISEASMNKLHDALMGYHELAPTVMPGYGWAQNPTPGSGWTTEPGFETWGKIAAPIEWTPDTHAERGLPRPMYDDMPIPWTSEGMGDRPMVSIIDAVRQREALNRSLCVLCGLPLADPVYAFADHSDNVIDGGLHGRCLNMTASWCPHLKDRLLRDTGVIIMTPLPAWQQWIQSSNGGRLVGLPDATEILEGQKRASVWERTSSVENDIYYHESPSKNRASILEHGLRASWDADVDPEPGVFMTPQPQHWEDEGSQFSWIHLHLTDIWEINANGLEVKRDPWGDINGVDYLDHVGGSFYVPHDIPPDRLRLAHDGLSNSYVTSKTASPNMKVIDTPVIPGKVGYPFIYSSANDTLYFSSNHADHADMIAADDHLEDRDIMRKSVGRTRIYDGAMGYVDDEANKIVWYFDDSNFAPQLAPLLERLFKKVAGNQGPAIGSRWTPSHWDSPFVIDQVTPKIVWMKFEGGSRVSIPRASWDKWVEDGGVTPLGYPAGTIENADLVLPWGEEEQQYYRTAMALTPEMYEQLPDSLWHVTQRDHVPFILREGLRPASETGWSRDTGFWSPRPGHVYLSTDIEQSMESGRWQDPELDMGDTNLPVLLRIDKRQLDPQRFKADEDHFVHSPGQVGSPPDAFDPEYYDRSLGDWAEEKGLDDPNVVWDSIQGSRTVAYEGTIPPNAITVWMMPRGDDRFDFGVAYLHPDNEGLDDEVWKSVVEGNSIGRIARPEDFVLRDETEERSGTNWHELWKILTTEDGMTFSIGYLSFDVLPQEKRVIDVDIAVYEEYSKSGAFQQLIKPLIDYRSQGYTIEAEYGNTRLEELMKRRLEAVQNSTQNAPNPHSSVSQALHVLADNTAYVKWLRPEDALEDASLWQMSRMFNPELVNSALITCNGKTRTHSFAGKSVTQSLGGNTKYNNLCPLSFAALRANNHRDEDPHQTCPSRVPPCP
jgi:hypothetical protein